MPAAAMDTGPLVAYFCSGETHHAWAVQQFQQLSAPLLTCEPVLTESAFLLARQGVSPRRLLEKVVQGVFRIGLRLDAEAAVLNALMQRYRNVPMSLADACLVRLAEIHALPICTLDSDFAVYRARGRTRLTLITPDF